MHEPVKPVPFSPHRFHFGELATPSYVHRFEIALQEIGIPLTNPARVAEEYLQWLESIMKKMDDFFAPYRNTSFVSSTSEIGAQLVILRSAWIYRFANKRGDRIHTANLREVLHDPLGVKQHNEFLILQRESSTRIISKNGYANLLPITNDSGTNCWIRCISINNTEIHISSRSSSRINISYWNQ